MTERAIRQFEGTPLGWLPAPLREARRPFLAILAGWLTCFVPSLFLSWASQSLFPGMAPPDFEASGRQAMFLLVLFAPVVETVIMATVLSVLLRFVPPVAAILLSSAGWGVAHSLAAPLWGMTIWWPFLIFSTLFVVWRQRGWWTAVAIVASVHALQNLIPALFLATRA